MDLARSNAR